MDFCQYSDAQQFLQDVSGFLERKEAENNLSLGILHSLANAPTTVQSTQGEPFLAVVREDGLPVLTLVMTPPNKLVIAGEGPELREAVRMAVNRFASRSVSIPGVIGEPEAATTFVEAWGERTGSSPEIIMNQRIYKLEHVSRVPMSTGALRAAEPGDAARVAIWVQDFFRVISETISYEQALQKAMRSIETGSLTCGKMGNRCAWRRKPDPRKMASSSAWSTHRLHRGEKGMPRPVLPH